MARLNLFLFLSLPFMPGCAAEPPQWQSAEAKNLVADGRTMRLLSAAKRFERHFPMGSCRFELIDRPKAGAFAWTDGRIAVTRGLIDLLDDEELAAAVSHEIGHLLADGHLSGRVGLHGTSDVEVRADTLGCQLLIEAGIPPASMKRMLEKLATAPGLTPRQRAAVKARIQRLG